MASTITYEKYTFTIDEMHAVVKKQHDDSERVWRLGAAAFDDMSMDEILDFDMGRTLAIMDYYNLVFLPDQAKRK